MKKLAKKLIPYFFINWYHFFLAFLGAVIYRFPSREIKVIGITGTSGKSTVAELIYKILETAGFRTALISTIEFRIAEKVIPNTLKMTMPGRFRIQKFLRQAVKAGCQYAVLEVTSEGIKQHRHRFINFDTAVFTNLYPEHIEAHQGFENYKRAKGKLFQITRDIHIINLDDENSDYFLKFPAHKKIGFGIKGQRAKERRNLDKDIEIIEAEKVELGENYISFQIQMSGGRVASKFQIPNSKFQIHLVGSFNVYNALAAICVGLSQGINLEIIKKALEKVRGVPGRMEEVISQPFKVIVDYAHTPGSLEKVYQTIRNLEPKTYNLKPKLICVLGSCGGGRDKWKRPVLGRIAAEYCDEAIITNEDPYDENPYQILSEIKSGIFNSQFSISNFYEILDRREAIRKALKLAKRNDIIIITGKGSEPWICVAGGKKVPWDDRKIVKEEFERLYDERVSQH